MTFKKACSELNIFSQCQKYEIPLWQCPQFLFLIMGLVVIGSTLAAYFIGVRLVNDPLAVTLVILFLTSILLVIAFVITNSFERLGEASRMKSEFVSVVSHQLRSPLSNLKWAIEFLMAGRADPISEKQLEYFKILKENSARMHELVSNLLIVSRIETARLTQKQEEFSLVQVVKDLVSQFYPFAKASNVEIVFSPAENLPKVFADSFQIRQVVENLLDNAVRYVKEKGRVEIAFQEKGMYLHVGITDNGVGIPQADQKFIFQKFFRSSNALKYQTQGSGLGLYIARAIIEKAGGKIGFKSKENQGSTFWFTLPVK